ncbi:M48 family metallopeptidase [Fundidesulfovibrio agrisoli]|uniref:M48 family metallopeptidase n=1 Tax=Fundidesulfovibrio agrisoli TaxID=2922717 RepID=UPI001FABD495|nr:M48 family metallopeptidase [Fundidesulfovibrio agrisoli]
MLLNGPTLFVLSALVLSYLVTGLARRLNLRCLSDVIPPEFEGVFDPGQYRRSQEYMRAGARLEQLRESFDTFLACAFVLAGGIGWADSLARGLAGRLGLGELGVGLTFLGGLALAQAVLSLPFDVYATFRLEARFGFNRTTPGLFIADRLKGLALGAILGGTLVSGVIWAYMRLGSAAWLAAWGVVAGFTALMLWLGPAWLLPLFNRFTPLPPGELRSAIEAFAARHGIGLDGIFVMDGSRRSAKANAFVTGLGRKKRISLYDTLMDRLSHEQVVAVLAHEVGHSLRRHILKGFVTAMLKTGLLLAVLQAMLASAPLQLAFGVAQPSVHVGLAVFALAYQPLALLLAASANALSRRFEFEADAFAADSPERAKALAGALKELSVANLANLNPHPLAVWLHYTHPPVLERVRRLEDAARAGEAGMPTHN